MDDFRSQLSSLVDAMMAEGVQPVFLVVDLDGIEQIKRTHDAESVATFRQTAIGAVVSAGHGCEAFSYGDERVVAILPGFDRLKTFAVIEKLRRGLPLLAQSFDCYLRPEFDVLEYDAAAGIPGLIGQLARRPSRDRDVA
jgi:hypothetical protein